MAKVDSTVETHVTGKYGINGYPTIKIFVPGQKDPEDYNGGRDAASIIRTGLNKLDSSGKPPSIPQLISSEVLNNNCEKEVCIIAFLPHIYDSTAEERGRYISTFTESAKKNRGKPLKFLWAQASDFYKFEQLVGLGMGYPAVVGFSMSKSRYAVMRSAFNVEEIEGFIKKLLTGHVALIEYKELPKLAEVQPWDGKDHQPETVNEDL